jgi:hypothetical protein
MQTGEVVQLLKRSGSPVRVGGFTLTPQSEALVLRWPRGGLIWNRPVAVTVEQDGQQERLPVTDVTRLIQVGLLFLTLAVSVVGWTVSMRRKDSSERS